VAGRNFLPAPTTIQTRAAVQITLRRLTTVQALEFPLQTALTMQRGATLAETAGLRWICIGPSLRPESSLAIHRPRSGMSPVTIRRPNTMNPDTIRLRRAMNLVAHIQDQGQGRATAVAAHTHAATVAVDTHRTAAADPHPMAVEAVHRPTVAEATPIHIRARAPAPITDSGAARTLLVRFARPKQNEQRKTNRRSFCA